MSTFDTSISVSTLVDNLLQVFSTDRHEIHRRPPHLRPFYYRIALTSRPFGLALCKTFDEKYLCVVLPASPSGQMGLRTGSEILAINNFALESENMKELNIHFSDKKDQFLWMYKFPKIEYLSDNNSMPITLYLKYDPMKILTETESLKRRQKKQQTPNKLEDCLFWKQLQEDIFRWAINEQTEKWTVIQDCPLVSQPPIQSSIIQSNIMKYITDNKSNIQQYINDDGKENEINLRTMQDFIQTDEQFTIVDYIEAGTEIEVYAKAGAYIEIREPISGWIKFLDCYGKKDEKIAEKNAIQEASIMCTNINVKHWKEYKTSMPVFITNDYLQSILELEEIKKCKIGIQPTNGSGQYSLNVLIHILNGKYKRYTVLYLMGDIDFGHTLETQNKHLLRLQDMKVQYAQQMNCIVVRICCLNRDSESTLLFTDPLMVNGRSLSGDIIFARSQMQILKYFDLFQFQIAFFKYGLLLLDTELNVVIHPKMSVERLEKGQLFDASVLEILKQKQTEEKREAFVSSQAMMNVNIDQIPMDVFDGSGEINNGGK